MPRHPKNAGRHRKPGIAKQPWLTRKGESTYRGFITFTAVVVAFVMTFVVSS